MNTLITELILVITTAMTAYNPQVLGQTYSMIRTEEKILAVHDLDLSIREKNAQINEGFADNIILSLHYLNGENFNNPVNWEKIRQPFDFNFTLKPGETFAFHNKTLDEFSDPVKTMNSRFFTDEGYKYVAGLGGNGVCHIASLINWVAKDADLKVVSPVAHDFAPVPGVPQEYGTAIFYPNPEQNLYIKNTKDFPVIFHFKVSRDLVILNILHG